MDDEGESAIATLDEIGIKEVRLRDTLMRATNATELFSRAQATANRAWKENTALTIEANKRYATTESKLINLKNKAVLFGQQIGNDLDPTIQNLIEGAGELLDKFMGWMKPSGCRSSALLPSPPRAAQICWHLAR